MDFNEGFTRNVKFCLDPVFKIGVKSTDLQLNGIIFNPLNVNDLECLSETFTF